MLPMWIRGAALAIGASGLTMPMDGVQDQLDAMRAKLSQVAPAAAPAANAALSSAFLQWKQLQTGPATFYDYATFLLAHPGWPNEMAMRRAAEASLSAGAWSPGLAVSYFRRFPPLNATAAVRQVEALAASGLTGEASAAARAAWVRGVLSPVDEAKLMSGYSAAITLADQDARMDMLLWQGSTSSAARQILLTSTAKRPVFEARLAMRTNVPDASARIVATEAMGRGDPGYLADRATWLKNNNAWPSARDLLAAQHNFTTRPAAAEKWFETLLDAAKGASADAQYSVAFNIARQVDDAYPAGTDVSTRPYGERDDYTSLVWLAGQTAMGKLYRPGDAVGMFERYANASRNPTTQSKGYYWAGRAAQAAGRTAEANAFFEHAAGYRDQFYGQLANERLSRPLIAPTEMNARPVEPSTRAAFYARENVRAAQYLGTIGAWEDQTAFVRQIAIDATTDSDHVLSAELARALNRPDLGVMVGRSAMQNGLTDYAVTGFPTVKVPDGQASYWTMVHAIARQESQFDRAAVSHAGARGLMQLMPGTARETAGKLGLSYDTSSLTQDTDYNIQLGSTYFQRMFALYGSYPLAVAAYNAGPGNVNKWLRANGDPRMPGTDMVDWIESIPIYETKNYVQRVLENAVVYDLMNPVRARSKGPANISWYLGKQQPG
ncbi:transglycosylase SLT domain-containing protein [soil metagenome]